MHLARLTDRSPIISVCVPAYQASKTIRDCLVSVISQDAPEFELIVIDDCSTDNTLEIAQETVKSFGNAVVLKNLSNIGATRNWNRTLDIARGKYVKLLCSDDLLAPESLRIQADILSKNPSLAMVSGPRNIISENGKILFKGRGLSVSRWGRLSINRNDLAKEILIKATNPLSEPSGCLIRREALVKIGGWSEQWRFMADIATYCALAQYGDIGLTDAISASFRLSNTSWSSRLARQQAIEAKHFLRELQQLHGLRYTEYCLSVVKSMALSVVRRSIVAVNSYL